MALSKGQRIGPYEIVGALGAGGMGQVYRARDHRLARDVAVKVIDDAAATDPTRLRRFEREARAASALNHPNIIAVYDVGREGLVPYIVMELVTGQTLRRALAAGPLPTPELLKLAAQVADGLAKAHEAGIIHRDLKPENLMITHDGFVKILDFGLAKQLPGGGSGSDAPTVDRDPSRSGAVVGTASYMSPEQTRGMELDFRSDQFSLGAILYEAASGKKLFAEDSFGATLIAIAEREPAPLAALNPGIPDRFAAIVHRLLSKARDERFDSTRELASELRRIGRIEPDSIALTTTPTEASSAAGTEAPSSSAVAPEKSPVLVGGERRNATIVVSRLSGYDDLLEEMDPTELDELTSSLRTDASEIASSFDGVLNHFDTHEWVLLFGMRASSEDHFRRAVLAAKRLQEAIGELGRSTSEPLQLQTGIHTGYVVSQRSDSGDAPYRIAGEALEVATTIVGHAGDGEILMSGQTRYLISPFFEAEKVEDLKVRGANVPVFRVGAASGARSRLDAEKNDLTTYTGRSEELDTLLRGFDKARAGHGTFVSVIGEAGLGKSRLLVELVRRLQSGEVPCRIIPGRCRAEASATPYVPFVEALTVLLEVDESVTTEDIASRILTIEPDLEEFISIYLHLLGREDARYPLAPDLKGETFQLTTIHCLSSLFTFAAQRTPVVLLLEDWHWSDASSRATLNALVELAPAHPVLAVASSRPSDTAETLPSRQGTTIRLTALEALEAAAIARAVLGVEELPSDLGERIHERTGGNPFFIEELCRSLVEEETVSVANGIATLDGPLEDVHIPTTVQAVIRARIDRLDADAQGLLRVAAVIGREFSARLLARAIGDASDNPSGLTSLKELDLIQAVRVVPEPVFRFKHALTQDVAYESLLKHQRKRAHQAVGEAIEAMASHRLNERAFELAQHFSQAGDWDKAVHYGRIEATRLDELRRPPESLELLERVEGWVERIPDEERRRSLRIEVLMEQEARCAELTRRARQQEILDEITPLVAEGNDKARLSDLYARQGRLHSELDRVEAARANLDESVALAREAADPLAERRALEALGFLYWRQHDLDNAIACNEASLAISRELSDHFGEFSALANLTTLLRNAGRYDEALRCNDETFASLEALDDQHMMVHAHWLRAQVYRELGRIEEAIDLYRSSHEKAKKLGKFATAPIDLATLLWSEGRRSESIEVFNDLIDYNRKVGNLMYVAAGHSTLAQLYLHADEPGTALPHLLESAGAWEQIGDRESQEETLSHAAATFERLGQYKKAAATWNEVRRIGENLERPDIEVKALERLAQLERLPGGDAEKARTHLYEALGVARDSGDKAAESEVLNSLGIHEWTHGHYPSALAHYEAALAIVRDIEDRKHEGLLLASLGVTLRKLGRRDEAFERLEEAVAIHRKNEDSLLEGHALAALGDTYREDGIPDRALECYQDSLQIRRAIGDRSGEGWMLLRLAELSSASKLEDLARDYAAEATVIADECDDARLREACAELGLK